ncbi:hypothetical protein BDY24DRAFT_184863 [Mrakia frigida]|uniref:uncharacterized protein n=1 Tax=Mrakia frigida TaxID=29902 RepID=UPI003FCBF86E
MVNPLVLYTTSLPQPARPRTQQEYLIRTLYTLRIPCDVVDVSLDEEGKRIWRRKGRTDGKLPGFLVDGEFAGTIEDFEYAVEDGRLRDFLGIDHLSTPLPTPLAPKPKPATVAPSPPPPPPPADASSSTTTNPEPSATLPLSTSSTTEPTTTKITSEDDELLESVGEDELEKLLREMEAEGM